VCESADWRARDGTLLGLHGHGLIVLMIMALLFFWVTAQAAPVNLEKLLKLVDDIRNPAESYFMKVTVTNSDNLGEPDVFEVLIGGSSKTLINSVAPPINAGKKYLMLDEDMWAFTPDLARPVRISLSERLSGQTANGDIGRMRWSGDYAPTLESEDTEAWVLFLKAKKKNLTYEQVRVWIRKKNYFPIKAEFLSVQGKPLKFATYQDFKKIAKKIRPTTIIIQDAKIKTDTSTIRIKQMKARSFPASTFNQNSLK
jgi:outer membrane lipoprotein-sorting protein